MIDLRQEQLIPIREVPRLLPARRTGRHVHISAVYRWMTRGIRGVRLEAAKVGGATYTSVEALQRFSERLSARAMGDGREPGVADPKRVVEVAKRVEGLLQGRGVGRRGNQGSGRKPT